MKNTDIASLRLQNQRVASSTFTKPENVVRHMGAMQAQDYLGALWAVGLRMKTSTEKEIEQSLIDGKIIRTWPMRGTLHFVASVDAMWMLKLMGPRVISGARGRMKNLGLEDETVDNTRKVWTKALQGKKALTRAEMYEVLDREGISSKEYRGLHLLWRIAQEGTTCFGPRRGKQQTFVLFDEWVKKSKDLKGEEALAEITLRYFTSHGPALIQDFMWWSGLPATKIKKGIELNKNKLVKETIEEKDYFMAKEASGNSSHHTHYMLPAFDEYLVSYKDRSAMLEELHKQKVNPGSNGMLQPVIVVNGQVLGTWKRVIKKDKVEIKTHPFTKKSNIDPKVLKKTASAYAKFLGLSLG